MGGWRGRGYRSFTCRAVGQITGGGAVGSHPEGYRDYGGWSVAVGVGGS